MGVVSGFMFLLGAFGCAGVLLANRHAPPPYEAIGALLLMAALGALGNWYTWHKARHKADEWRRNEHS